VPIWVVNLTSSDTGRVTVPASVTILAGQTSVALPLTVVDNTLLDGPESISITATTTNRSYFSGTGTILIHDNETAVLAVTLPASARENDGVLVNAGSVKASKKPTRDIVIQLSSSDTSEITVPATVTILAGQDTARFDVTVINDFVVDGTQTATVTARVDNWTTSSASINVLEAATTFQWNAIASPRYQGIPFAATATVVDGNGHVLTDFNGTAKLSGQTGTGGTVTIGTTYMWDHLNPPLDTSKQDNRLQALYLASQIGAAGPITSLALNVAVVPGQAMNNWTIRMKHTPASQFGTSWESGGWTTVYQANQTISATGWNTFNFGTSFNYDGYSNLIVDFSFNNSSTSTTGEICGTYSGYDRILYATANSDYGDPLTWSGTTPTPVWYSSLPTIRLSRGAPLPMTPTTATFVNGVWTGNVMVSQTANDVYLRVNDGAGHAGLSNVFNVLPPVPDLTVAKTRSGVLTVGDVGDTYTITVTNSGSAATSGTVSLIDSLPTGLTATAMSGDG
jgi:uncharacterized repeat protein (TIGR01451 family)